MHRFFVSPADISGDTVAFPRDLSRQISRVLRMSPGDEVTVLDDTGWEYLAALSVVNATRAEARIVSRYEGLGEPAVRLTLYQAMIRPERFEWALQKCTELGIVRFVPLITRRAERRSRDVSANRRQRWQRIIREAAEQSRRSRLPALDEPQTLEKALKSATRPVLMAWEAETIQSLKSSLEGRAHSEADLGTLSIIVGPEGGFDHDEVELAREYNVETVGLGNRILRSETAAVTLTTAIMHEFGELEP